ncbi:MAG TPA: hypothetical protein VJP07_05565 [Dehalococcoidia bacterium]|nr:hypothetical protein [Dehalococcoidia bacterium]
MVTERTSPRSPRSKTPLPRRRSRKPLGQIIADLTKDVPEADLARLPRDGSANHDHYIYGTPKQYK